VVELDAVGRSWVQGWIGAEAHLKQSSIGDENDFNPDYVSPAKLGQPFIL
jgi:hypothetical protein